MIDFQDMIHQVDKDGTGSLDSADFLMMICLKLDVEIAEDEIREVVQVLMEHWYLINSIRFNTRLVMAMGSSTDRNPPVLWAP